MNDHLLDADRWARQPDVPVRRQGVRWHFDGTWGWRLISGWLEKTQPQVTPRRYELDCFCIQAELRSIYPRTHIERVRELVRLSPPVWRGQRHVPLRSANARATRSDPTRRLLAERALLRRPCRPDSGGFSVRGAARRPKSEGRRRDRMDATQSRSTSGCGDYVENPATGAFHGVLSRPSTTARQRSVFASRFRILTTLSSRMTPHGAV